MLHWGKCFRHMTHHRVVHCLGQWVKCLSVDVSVTWHVFMFALMCDCVVHSNTKISLSSSCNVATNLSTDVLGSRLQGIPISPVARSTPHPHRSKWSQCLVATQPHHLSVFIITQENSWWRRKQGRKMSEQREKFWEINI